MAAFLAQNKIIHDGSNDEELGEKLALFDAVNGSGGRHSKELLEDTVRSMGASEMVINADSIFFFTFFPYSLFCSLAHIYIERNIFS